MTKWISVGELLPEIGTECIVLYDRNEGDFWDRLNKPRYSVYGAQLREIDCEGYATWQLGNAGKRLMVEVFTYYI